MRSRQFEEGGAIAARAMQTTVPPAAARVRSGVGAGTDGGGIGKPGRGAWALLAIVLCGQAMASRDSSIVTVAGPSMRAQLPATGAQVQLIAAGYLVAFAALVVTGARLGDQHGHLRMFRLGLAAFTGASLACGLAPGAVALIASRVAQGAAGAMMVPQVLSLIHLRFHGTAQARAIGLYSMVLAVGVACGQVLGGLIVGADLFRSSRERYIKLRIAGRGVGCGAGSVVGAVRRTVSQFSHGPPRASCRPPACRSATAGQRAMCGPSRELLPLTAWR